MKYELNKGDVMYKLSVIVQMHNRANIKSIKENDYKEIRASLIKCIR